MDTQLGCLMTLPDQQAWTPARQLLTYNTLKHMHKNTTFYVFVYVADPAEWHTDTLITSHYLPEHQPDIVEAKVADISLLVSHLCSTCTCGWCQAHVGGARLQCATGVLASMVQPLQWCSFVWSDIRHDTYR